MKQPEHIVPRPGDPGRDPPIVIPAPGPDTPQTERDAAQKRHLLSRVLNRHKRLLFRRPVPDMAVPPAIMDRLMAQTRAIQAKSRNNLVHGSFMVLALAACLVICFFFHLRSGPSGIMFASAIQDSAVFEGMAFRGGESETIRGSEINQAARAGAAAAAGADRVQFRFVPNLPSGDLASAMAALRRDTRERYALVVLAPPGADGKTDSIMIALFDLRKRQILEKRQIRTEETGDQLEAVERAASELTQMVR